MPQPPTHPWTFRAHFRKNAFGWKSQPAMERIKEAVATSSAVISAAPVVEAYARFGLLANRSNTYLNWFRALSRKYPDKPASVVLDDLVAFTPGDEGKWFAAAKTAELFDEAIALANRTPCSPRH
jgi:hypothetical protein